MKSRKPYQFDDMTKDEQTIINQDTLKKAFQEYIEKVQLRRWAVEQAVKIASSSAVPVDLVRITRFFYSFVSGDLEPQDVGGTVPLPPA